jgi:hypothetical protein
MYLKESYSHGMSHHEVKVELVIGASEPTYTVRCSDCQEWETQMEGENAELNAWYVGAQHIRETMKVF